MTTSSEHKPYDIIKQNKRITMKYLKIVVPIILLILVSIYMYVFSSSGNAYIQNTIEAKLQENLKLDSKVSTFTLDSSTFLLHVEITPNNRLEVEGSYGLISKTMDVKYRLTCNDLSELESLTKQKIIGEFHTNGTVIGSFSAFDVVGKSSVSNSDTTYKISINPDNSSVTADVAHLDIVHLLEMINQPSYFAKADMQVAIKIDNLDDLKGAVQLEINNALLNAKTMKETLKTKTFPPLHVTLHTDTKLNKDEITTALNLKTPLLSVITKESKLNLKTQALESDFLVKKIDLAKLKFITERDLLTTVDLEGVVSKRDVLHLDAHSKFAQGDIDIKLRGDALTLEAKKLQSLKLLYILTYPEYFDSNIDATVAFNLQSQKGDLHAAISSGKFTKNGLFDTVDAYTKTSIYKERFNGNVDSKIDKDALTSDISLKSNKTSITSKKSYLNSKTKKIDTKLKIVSGDTPVGLHVTHTLDDPKVDIDATKLIKKEATKHIGNYLKSLF